MRISETAAKSGLSTKTIRFYEEKGLVTPNREMGNGYRDYGSQQVAELHLIKQARAAGFNLTQCQALLDLYRDPHRHSERVKQHAQQRVAAIEHQIQQLRQVQQQLQSLIDCCPGGKHANCPIIKTFIGSR